MKKLSVALASLVLACMALPSAYAAPPGALDPPVVAAASAEVQTCQIAQVGKLTEVLDLAPTMSILSTSNAGEKPEVQGRARTSVRALRGAAAQDAGRAALSPERWRT